MSLSKSNNTNLTILGITETHFPRIIKLCKSVSWLSDKTGLDGGSGFISDGKAHTSACGYIAVALALALHYNWNPLECSKNALHYSIVSNIVTGEYSKAYSIVYKCGEYNGGDLGRKIAGAEFGKIAAALGMCIKMYKTGDKNVKVCNQGAIGTIEVIWSGMHWTAYVSDVSIVNKLPQHMVFKFIDQLKFELASDQLLENAVEMKMVTREMVDAVKEYGVQVINHSAFLDYYSSISNANSVFDAYNSETGELSDDDLAKLLASMSTQVTNVHVNNVKEVQRVGEVIQEAEQRERDLELIRIQEAEQHERDLELIRIQEAEQLERDLELIRIQEAEQHERDLELIRIQDDEATAKLIKEMQESDARIEEENRLTMEYLATLSEFDM